MDVLRAVGISLVVLRHSFSPYRGSWDVSKFYDYSLTVDYIGSYISTISMPLFVFISGYIYYFLKAYLGKYSNYKILFKKKSRRLIVPYIILAPIYIYFFLDFESLKTFLAHLWTDSGHLWFLLMMYIMFLLYYKFENFLINNNIIIGILIGAFLYIISTPLIAYNFQPIGRVSRYFIFFLLGNYFSKNSLTILKLLKGKVFYIFSIHLLLFSTYFYLSNVLENKYLLIANKQMLLILSLLALCFVYGFLDFFVQKYRGFLSKINPSIRLINNTSYYIYLIHQPILKVYFTFLFVQKFSPIIGIPLAFIVSISISIFLAKIILKSKAGRELIGSK
tara:strand:- start:2189 stop:3193 length:1005 start_codon:yes stop_codon:yes gene_type:complete